MGFEKYVVKNGLGFVKKDKTFKQLTTMKVGGKIKYTYYPTSINKLSDALIYLKKKRIKYIFIGNGSNIIASDKKYRGVVIVGKYLPQQVSFVDNLITVSAFYDLRKLVGFLVGQDIDSLTGLAGIPGTVGGGIYMNAGANGYVISSNLNNIKVLENNIIKTYYKKDLIFDYRYSSLMKKDIIILEASFNIVRGDNLFVRYNEYLLNRKENHPLLYPNCGSVFRNTKDKKAYEIINELGLQGYKIGNAQISTKHSNFIVNLGSATSNDVYRLINLIHVKGIKNNYNMKLEVILFNF